MKIHPWNQVLENAELKMAQGFDIFQQWNCEHCGVKQTMPDANTFFERGICEECQKETNIKKNGMNFMATIGIKPR